MKSMTVWGVGPRWGALTIVYGVLAYLLGRRFAFLLFPDAVYPTLVVVGILLIMLGLPLYVLAAKAMFRGFSAGQLVTSGPYGICRHPIYGAWIVFIIPGAELLLGSWFGLSTDFVGYGMLRILAAEEESYLGDKFGEDYLRYKTRVPFVLPIGWLTKK